MMKGSQKMIPQMLQPFKILFFCCLLVQLQAFSQETDTAKKKYSNIIKYSISSYVLYPRSFHMGFEKVISRNKSIYVFGGYNEFPLNLNLDLSNTNFSDSKNKTGYSMGAEFRFYLSKENKFDAPHGIYLAPYLSYYQFSSSNTLTHTDSTGSQSININSSISLFNVGAELGYQFVVFKRFVIDVEMFGPSFTAYAFQVSTDGQFSGIDQNETLQAVLTALKNKFPLLNDLSTSKEVYRSGVASSKFPAVGFRYAVCIGFMF